MASSTWYGFSAPFIDGSGKVLGRQEDERLIKNDLLQLLFTIPGERVMSPDFGVNLRNVPFEQLDEQMLSELELEIRNKIARFETRVIVSDVEVKGKSDEQLVTVTIRGALTNDKATDFLFETSFPFSTATSSIQTATQQQLR